MLNLRPDYPSPFLESRGISVGLDCQWSRKRINSLRYLRNHISPTARNRHQQLPSPNLHRRIWPWRMILFLPSNASVNTHLIEWTVGNLEKGNRFCWRKILFSTESIHVNGRKYKLPRSLVADLDPPNPQVRRGRPFQSCGRWGEVSRIRLCVYVVLVGME